MAKKKKKDNGLYEFLGVATPTKTDLIKMNLEEAKRNAPIQSRNNTIAPINNAQDTARKILTPGVAPINLNTSGGFSEYQEAQKKQQEAEAEKKKAEELRRKVANEKMQKGILSQTQMQDKAFANQFNNQMSDKVKIPNKKDEKTTVEKKTGRTISPLEKKKGETDLQAIIRTQKENAEKDKKYKQTSKIYQQMTSSEQKAKNNKMKIFKNYSDDDDNMQTVFLKQIAPQYQNMKKSDLLKEKKKVMNEQSKLIQSGKDGKTSREWWYKNNTVAENVGNVLFKMFGEKDPKDNSDEMNELLAREVAIQKALDNVNVKNKKFDKSISGKSEKLSLSIASGFERGTKGIETSAKKILGVETKEEKKYAREQIKALGGNQSYVQQLSDKAISETQSKFGRAVLEIGQSTGQMMPQMFVSGSKLSTLIGFANYGGSSYNDAINDGYTEEQATKYGVVNGALEMALNKVLPSFKINGKNIYGKTMSDKLSSKIMSKITGNSAIKSAIMDATGEFTEEYLQSFLDPIVREALLEEDNGVGIKNAKDFDKAVKGISEYTSKNFFSKENLRAGILGFATSGMLGGTNTYNAYKYEKQTGRSAETGLTRNEQSVVDNIVENRKQQLKEQNGKVTKKEVSKIEKEVRQDLERGYIDTNDIERALSNETWTRHNEVVKQKENIQNQLKELQSKKMSDMTVEEYNSTNNKISELEEQINNLDLDTTRSELNASMNGKVTDKDTLLQQVYGQELEKQNDYKFDEKEEQTKFNKTINDDIKNLKLNNHIKTRDTVDLLKKLSNETGKQYRLIDNNDSRVNKFEGKTINGFVENGEVFVNIDSDNLINRILGHETTHLFEGTEEHSKLRDIAKIYAETKGEYESRRKALQETYKDVKDADIENELTADIVGDYIFSDIDFVRNLSTEQPNMFQKIYNRVKHLYNMATAGSKEARQLEKLKYNFEKVYKENNQSKVTSNNIKYALKNSINNAINDVNSKNVFEINTISDETASKIKELTGIEVKNRKQVLYDNDIRHMLKEHGNKQKETDKGQIALTPKDLLNIPDILENYDELSKGAEHKEGKTIRYKKNYSDNQTTIVEVIPKKSSLKIKTMWKTTLDNSNSIAPISTSKTQMDSTLIKNNIPQNEQKVNSDTSTKYSIQNKENNAQELDNSSFSLKQKQLDIIQKNNPVYDDYHTWIRNIDDIKTLEETLQDEDWADYDEINPDLTKQDLLDAIKRGKITVYSSYPIEQGIFVSPSKMEAESYSGDGKVYSKEVNIKDVAWIDPAQGQYAKVESIKYSISNKDSQSRTLTKEQQEYFKDSKATDENGNLKVVYHGTTEEINVFEKNRLGNNTGASSANEGFFFTDTKKIAEDYSRYARPQYIKDLENEYKRLEKEAQKTGNWDDYYRAYEKYEEAELTYAYNEDGQRSNAENQKEVYLNLINPLIHDFKGESYRDETYYDLLKQAKKDGNDGAIFLNTFDGYGEPGSWDNPMTNIYVAFESNQIKNVDNTNPTSNPDIRYQMSNKNDIAPIKKNNKEVFGKEMRKQQDKAVKEAMAPLKEEVKALKKEVAELKEETTYNDLDNFDGDLADYVPVDATVFHGEQISDLRNFTKNKYLGWGERAGIKDKLAKVRNELNFNDNLTPEQRKQLNTEEAQLSFALNYPNYRERLAEYENQQKKEIAPIEKAKENPNEYKPYLEMSREINPDETNKEVVDLLNKVDSQNENKDVKTKPIKQGKLSDAKRKAQYLFVNRNVEIDEYSRATGNKNIKILADHINNIQGEIATNINEIQTDNFGNAIGKGITQIYNQAREENLSEAFDDYLFNKSNIARHLQGKGSLVDLNESEQLVKAYEETYPQMKQWANEVNEYNTNLLYKQADAGLITHDLADNLVKMYDFYVPFMENIDSEFTPNETGQIKTRSTVKSARGGSNKNLLGFEEAMMRQTQSAITQIRKNQLYQEIVNTKNNSSMDFETNTNPNIEGGVQESGGKYYLTAYIDGKAVQTEIDKNLHHGLEQRGDKKLKQYERDFSIITKPLQVASNIRRNILTTWSPTFLITNPLKDLQDAPLNSKYAKDMAKNVPRAFKELSTGQGVELDAFLNMYGKGNLRGDYSIDSGLSDVTKLAQTNKKGSDLSDNGALQVSKNMLKKIPQINEIMEMAPRYAEYLASIENGCSQMEALYNAREVTVNFGRGGIITKALNRNGFTFMNASVQGFSKLIRNFSGDNGSKAVLGCIAKASTLGLAPALINAMLLGDDDDYEAIPDYIKDNYYLIKTSDNNFIRIPKGRMMSIFGSAGRRALERANGKRDELNLKEDISSYFSNAYNQVGVQNPSESNIFAPIIQAKNNKTWYGTDLVPKRLQTDKDGNKIPAKDQYDASTDKMSIWLGKVTGISPYKINYVVDQYSGGIGDMILPTITEEAQSKSNSVVGKALAPLKDKFTADSITDNKNVTNFYSKVESLGAKKNETGSKKDEMSYQYMRNLSFEMGSLYKEMREVQADKTLSNSKKYAKVQNIKAEINKIAEEGMRGYKDVESYENYARVGNREMYKYKSKNGKTGWSLSDSKYADDINTLGLSVKEKNDYYTIKMKMSDTASKYGEGEGSQRFRAVLKTIRKANLPSDAKYELYNSWYGKNNKISKVAQDVGIDADTYLDYQTADLSADKNRKGYSIRGSKANKVIRYLNKTNLDYGQKAILYRASFGYKGSYSSSSYSNAYNNTIINYLNTLDTTYEEDVDICKRLGFKVDRNGNIKW